jgi:DNA-binding GntR family transcriptional regulator
MKSSAIYDERARVSMAPLPSAARRTLGEHVLETLRKAIIAGAFAPGDHLAEGTLAQQFGVSRAPVREAMVQLEREGLLTFDKRGAALVTAFTQSDFLEISSLRLTLETAAARLACRNLTAADVKRLQENIDRMQSATHLLELTLLDVEFHDLIQQGARHKRLYRCWNLVRHQIEVWLARMHSGLDAPTLSTRELTVGHHVHLLESLQAGEEVAVEAMREHVLSWGRPDPAVPEERTS